nr:PREDICTED: zinc finger CCCH domain-containing protein 31-like [Daucus carota subsp. sativus]
MPRVSENVRDSRMPNSSKAGISFRSQPCCNFRTRGCGYGTSCRYSHEFRGIDQGELVVKEIGLGYNNVCKWYSSGKPARMAIGRFPHEDAKNGVDEFRKSHAISIAGYNRSSLKQDNRFGGSSFGAKQDNRPVDVSLRANQAHQRQMSWKTRLCNKWETVNECLYGSK